MSEGGNLEAPPVYGATNDPNAPPPSYDSLFWRVKEMRKSSTGLLDFTKKIVSLLVGTLGCTLLIGLSLVIPISMVVIGSYFFHDCRAERYIPIYLIVGGIFGAIKELLNLYTRWQQTRETSWDEEDLLKPSTIDSSINCFLFAWFIAGSVWIYRTYEPEYEDTSSARYCHKTIYLFAFWLTTSSFIISGILLVCFCCICIVSLALQSSE